MSHEHNHNHHHNHSHIPHLTDVSKAFVIGIVLNLLFVIAEVIAGFMMSSLSLLGDAGHNLTDVGSLLISLLAFRLLKVKPTATFTYGYRKTSVLAALLNGALLLVTVGAIVYEGVRRLLHPETIEGNGIAIVAGIGIVINAGTALLFRRNKEHDLNVKGAYLHMMADALVSLAIVVAGIIIHFTGWYWLDAAASLLIAVVIFISTWSLLKESIRLSIDAVPSTISINDIQAAALAVKGVERIEHLHVWAISTTQNALTAHVFVPRTLTLPQIHTIKEELRHAFLHQNVQHSTIEIEMQGSETVECKSFDEVHKHSW